MIDKRFRGVIIGALRKLTRIYPPRNEAKKRNKIGPELHECPMCSRHIYTGKKDIEKVKLKFPKAEKGKIQLDHTDPFVALSGQSDDWNVIIERMFPPTEKWGALCSGPGSCHEKKTAWEAGERARIRKENKK